MKNRRTAILQKYQHYDARVSAYLDKLAAYSDVQLNTPPAEGGWSPIQVLHHLLLVEEGTLAYVRKKLSFNPLLEKIGLANYWRHFLLTVFIETPLKFKAPAGISGPNLPEFATLAETRARWEKARRDWAVFFGELPEELLDKQVFKHPFVGRLGWRQTVVFLDGHFRRHRRQIGRGILEWPT